MLPMKYNMILVQNKNLSSLRSLVGDLENGQNLLFFFVIPAHKSTHCEFIKFSTWQKSGKESVRGGVQR